MTLSAQQAGLRLFKKYNPGKLYKRPVFSRQYDKHYRIATFPFYDKNDIKLIRQWLRATVLQKENINNMFIRMADLNSRHQASCCQALMGFFNLKPSFLLDIQHLDLIRGGSCSLTKKFTVVMQLCFTPGKEKEERQLKVIIKACLKYLFRFEKVEKVIWTIYKKNHFLCNLAITSGFRLSKIKVVKRFNSFVVERKLFLKR